MKTDSMRSWIVTSECARGQRNIRVIRIGMEHLNKRT